MEHNGDELADEYLAALETYLGGAGEGSLHNAYEIGRKAIDRGLGVVDIAVVHHESLAKVLGRLPDLSESAQATRHAAVVEAESLSVFEMALRGYREANSQLTRLNEQLQQQAAELAGSNQQLRRLAAEMEQLAAAERRARVALEKTHDELKRTQSQLVQSAKLAALGELVGGVAHEINNPLTFVLNNLIVLQRDTQALHELIKLYQQADDLVAQHRPELRAHIRDFSETVDLPYTLESLNRLLPRSREGLKRIEQIVHDLRRFARGGQEEFQQVPDLNAGIASTVNIARGQAQKRGVDLQTVLEPLPPITCSPAKIHQVILNLVVNAIDACSAGGQVTVRTESVADGVAVHVIDTGRGIAPAIREKIFDPFFTTKPPGEGTGLGLSISHAIVQEHGGQIEVDSVPGQGSHFTVRLPRQPSAG